jgi:hypothetical protein
MFEEFHLRLNGVHNIKYTPWLPDERVSPAEYQGSLTLDSVQADLLARLQFYALQYKV